jgi:hypothetical protein
MKYVKVVEVDAHQWFPDKPHPEVMYPFFVGPNWHGGNGPCEKCGKLMAEHGWMHDYICPGDWITTSPDENDEYEWYHYPNEEFTALYKEKK